MARILIVDDDADVRFMMRIILERAGHKIRDAANGQAALLQLKDGDTDLLITDFLMPVMDGDELISRVRSDPKTAGLPIVGVTAHAYRPSSADVVVDKPFHPGRLVSAVDGLLAKGARPS